MRRTLVLVSVVLCSCSAPVGKPCGRLDCEPTLPIVETLPDAGIPNEADAGEPRDPACERLTRVTDPAAERAKVLEMIGATSATDIQEAGDDLLLLSRLEILVSAPTGEATRTALTAAPNSPLRGLSLVALEKTTDTADLVIVSLLREAPSSTAPWFANPAVRVTLAQHRQQWRIVSAEVYRSVIFATPANLAQLGACSRPRPEPSGPFTFEGTSFIECIPSGTYQYTSKPQDSILWGPGFGLPDRPAWHWRAGRWRVLQPARLIVSPANYWPKVGESDALCGGVVGWELLFDLVTSELFESKPGIHCTTC